MTWTLFGEEKVERIAEYRAIRVNETRQMFEALDWFAGYDPFEEAMRNAVMKVCADFESRRGKAGADGRRARSETKMKSEAHPAAMKDAEDVLAGLVWKTIEQP